MKVAIYAIAKNEEKHVERWMRSTTDADIRVLCDTGSVDGTLNEAELWYRHTHIHQINIMPWRFDLARNAALALVPPDVDVCISLDLDDTLRPGWRQELEANWKDHNVAQVVYNCAGVEPFFINTRVHSRAGWMWRDPCHEGLYSTGIEPKSLTLPNFHIDSYPDKTKPRSQYLSLLRLGIDEEPWNTRRMFYYARELMCYQHFEFAIGWFKKYLEVQGLSYDMNTELDKAVVNMEVDQARKFLYLCEGALREKQTGVKEEALWPFPLRNFNAPSVEPQDGSRSWGHDATD